MLAPEKQPERAKKSSLRVYMKRWGLSQTVPHFLIDHCDYGIELVRGQTPTAAVEEV